MRCCISNLCAHQCTSDFACQSVRKIQQKHKIVASKGNDISCTSSATWVAFHLCWTSDNTVMRWTLTNTWCIKGNLILARLRLWLCWNWGRTCGAGWKIKLANKAEEGGSCVVVACSCCLATALALHDLGGTGPKCSSRWLWQSCKNCTHRSAGGQRLFRSNTGLKTRWSFNPSAALQLREGWESDS